MRGEGSEGGERGLEGKEGGWRESSASKMWEINSALDPPTGRPAAPEGRHSNKETLLENLLSKMEAAATGFQEAGNDSRAPWGWKSKGRMCLEIISCLFRPTPIFPLSSRPLLSAAPFLLCSEQRPTCGADGKGTGSGHLPGGTCCF